MPLGKGVAKKRKAALPCNFLDTNLKFGTNSVNWNKRLAETTGSTFDKEAAFSFATLVKLKNFKGSPEPKIISQSRGVIVQVNGGTIIAGWGDVSVVSTIMPVINTWCNLALVVDKVSLIGILYEDGVSVATGVRAAEDTADIRQF